MLHRMILTAVALLATTFTAFPIDHQGEVSGTWYNTDSHHIVGNCEVPEGARLDIEAGCVVEFQGHFEIRVLNESASLYAIGTVDNPILFTADTEEHEYPGFWDALRAIGMGNKDDSSHITLRNCEIRYGGEAEQPMGDVDGVIQGLQYSRIYVDSCYIHDNSGSGISTPDLQPENPAQYSNRVVLRDSRIERCAAAVKISEAEGNSKILRNFVQACTTGMKFRTGNLERIANNIITNSLTHGVYIEYNPGPYFRYNTIDGTGEDGIHLVDASAPTISSCIILNCGQYCINCFSGWAGAYYDCFSNWGAESPCNGENVWCTDTLMQDPKLVSDFDDESYYHLKWDSPCLENGDPEFNNSNPAADTSDIGAYGGPDLEEEPYEQGLYWTGITGGNVGGTLDQDASPYHVFADFTVPADGPPLILETGQNENNAGCELFFDENTGVTAYGQLTIRSLSSTQPVVPVLLTKLGDNIWDGITMAVGSEVDFDYADISYADIGVYANDADLKMDYCHIYCCDTYGIQTNYIDFWSSHSEVSGNNGDGLYAYQTTAKLVQNNISGNTGNGILAINKSSIRADNTFPGVQGAFNDIRDNSEEEIDLQEKSIVMFHMGHNYITDEGSQLIYLMTTNFMDYVNNVENNWWGTNDPEVLDDLFYPLNRFDYRPWDPEAVQPESGFDSAQVAFATAAALENNGNYPQAIAAYQGVVADFPTSSVALEAIKRVFYLTDTIEGNFLSLVDYYQEIINTGSFTPLVEAADDLVKRCYVKAHEFQTALDLYEAVVANPPSLPDSVFAVIGVGYVYLAAEAGGGFDAPELVGSFPGLRPTSYQDYRQHCDELLAMITTTANQQAKKEASMLTPLGFTLTKPYPNPFNASTRISYSLLESRDVNLAVYNVLGRKVITLANGHQNAGDYHVIWSGESSTGIPVSSGIYFVRMSTETGVQSAKMLLLK